MSKPPRARLIGSRGAGDMVFLLLLSILPAVMFAILAVVIRAIQQTVH